MNLESSKLCNSSIMLPIIGIHARCVHWFPSLFLSGFEYCPLETGVDFLKVHCLDLMEDWDVCDDDWKPQKWQRNQKQWLKVRKKMG